MAAFLIHFALTSSVYCENYFSPCTCDRIFDENVGDYGSIVKCTDSSNTNIQKILNKPLTKFDNYIFSLHLGPNDTNMFAKMTGNRTFFTLTLDCSYAPKNLLIINSDAFTSTKIDTNAITLQNCDLSNFNWSFLTNFTYLNSISILNSSNLHTTFSTFPVKTMPWLKRLELNQIKGINGFGNAGLKFPDSIPNGLAYLSISRGYNNGNCKDCSIGDIALAKLLSWITPSSSKTLTSVTLEGNSLIQIPTDIVKFTRLSQFTIQNTVPMKIQSNAFNVSRTKDSYLNLDLGYSQITDVNSGAFQGTVEYDSFL